MVETLAVFVEPRAKWRNRIEGLHKLNECVASIEISEPRMRHGDLLVRVEPESETSLVEAKRLLGATDENRHVI